MKEVDNQTRPLKGGNILAVPLLASSANKLLINPTGQAPNRRMATVCDFSGSYLHNLNSRKLWRSVPTIRPRFGTESHDLRAQ